MVLQSTDHKQQRAKSKAAKLAEQAARAGRLLGGVELLNAFSDKMEGQPNVSKAFSKFRRLGGSSNAIISKDQFIVAMRKWGINATLRAMEEMWAILDKDGNGILNFNEFADGVVGNFSENASLGKIKVNVTKKKDGTIRIENEAVQWIITQLARAIQHDESSVRRTFARFCDRKHLDAGKIGVDFNAFIAVLKQLGIRPYPQQVEALFDALDVNRDGIVDIDEFGSRFFTAENMIEPDSVLGVAVIKKKKQLAKIKVQSTEEKMELFGTRVLKKIVGILMRNSAKAKREMENAFARFKKPVGSEIGLDKNAFRAAIKQMGIMVWVDEADALFNLLDIDGSGCVDSNEFFTGLLTEKNAIVEVYEAAKVSGAAEEFGLAAQKIAKMASQDAKALYHALMKWLGEHGSTPSDGFEAFLKTAGAKLVITQPEFKRGIKACGINATEAAMQELFAILDPNHDLSLDKDEFYDGFYSLDDQKLEASKKWNNVGPDKRTKKASEVARSREQRLAIESKFNEIDFLVNVLCRAYEVCCGKVIVIGVEKLHEIFNRFARHRKGTKTRGESVTSQEFRSVLAALAAQLHRTEANAVFKHFDKNKDHLIDFHDLCTGLKLPVSVGSFGSSSKNSPSSPKARSNRNNPTSRTQQAMPYHSARNTTRSRGQSSVSAYSMKERAANLQTPRNPPTARSVLRASGKEIVREKATLPGKSDFKLPQLTARGPGYTPRDRTVAIAAALSARRKNQQRALRRK